MIYLVSNQSTLFGYPEDLIRVISVEQSVHILSKSITLNVDTETTGLDFLNNKINLIQFGNKDNQIVVDVTTVDILNYKPILEDPKIEKIFFNAKFDLNFLYANNIFPYNVYDIMLADFVLNNGKINFYRSLQEVARVYINVELSKEARGFVATNHMSVSSIVYAANDVKYLKLIKDEIEKEVEETRVTKAVALENQFVSALSYLEYCGAYINREHWLKNAAENEVKLLNMKLELDKYLLEHHPEFSSGMKDLFSGEYVVNINWKSSKQVIPILKKEGVNVLMYDPKDKKMKESIGEKVLSEYKNTNELCSLLLKFSKMHKLVSTYGIKFLNYINSKTQRVHTEYTQMVSTGRLSSKAPNLQNIPKVKIFRSGFTNQFPNTVLINADYSGQESVVVANYSKDTDLINFYKNGSGDLHSYVAKRVYKELLKDIEEKDVKKLRPDLRQNSKEANFGIMYGSDGYALHKNMGIPLEEAVFIEKSFFESFPGLRVYFKRILNFALKNGFIPLSKITGRRFYIDLEEINKLKEDLKTTGDPYFKKELDSQVNEIRKLCQNMPIQGSSAEITKLALIYIFQYIRTKNLINVIKISLTVHDEILCEVPIEIAEETARVIGMLMAEAGKPYCDIVPLKAVPCISNYWDHN